MQMKSTLLIYQHSEGMKKTPYFHGALNFSGTPQKKNLFLVARPLRVGGRAGHLEIRTFFHAQEKKFQQKIGPLSSKGGDIRP